MPKNISLMMRPSKKKYKEESRSQSCKKPRNGFKIRFRRGWILSFDTRLLSWSACLRPFAVASMAAVNLNPPGVAKTSSGSKSLKSLKRGYSRSKISNRFSAWIESKRWYTKLSSILDRETPWVTSANILSLRKTLKRPKNEKRRNPRLM